ncbi:laminin EGF-like protein [Trichuris suis]|nr:laminin EGF-like protein [Trichuris suis]
MGRDCSRCKAGFYAINQSNPFGCQPCECDSGGSYSHICDSHTGQCHCKPRVGGRRCNEPIEAHFFPILQHIKYEAEDGFSPDYKGVRFATNEKAFPKFSGKGFVTFSTIQDEVYVPFDIPKSSVYLVLITYKNPTESDITVKFHLQPYFSREKEGKQKVEVRLPRAPEPESILLKTPTGQPHPFVLNPGRWILKVKTAQRFLLDNVVFLPESYVIGSALHVNIPKPCHFHLKELPCELLVYPDLSHYHTVGRSDFSVTTDGSATPMQSYPMKLQDTADESTGWINSENAYALWINGTSPGNYTILLSYQNFESKMVMADVQLDEGPLLSGSIIFEHCPYSTSCREVVVSQGRPWILQLKPQGAQIHIQPRVKGDIALISVTLIPSEEWDVAYLLPKSKCVKTGVHCFGYSFLPIPESVLIEAESGYRNQSVTGHDSDIEVYDPNTVLLPLIKSQEILHFTGRVAQPGKYVFMFHYYNPSQAHLPVIMHIQNIKNESFPYDGVALESANAIMNLQFCPSVSGCRNIVYGKDDKRSAAFDIFDKFDLSVFQNNVSGNATYFDYLLVVPLISYSDDLLIPQSVEHLHHSLTNCSQHLSEPLLHMETIDDECEKLIFSLTVDFNAGAMSCDCNLEGSTSFICERYGGQCHCKQNIVGRQCDKCRSGFFGFPECKPCNCSSNRMCDHVTGSCYCPPLTEGNKCERCKPRAYGFDPLIGCQECLCSAVGTIEQSLNCDETNGQCSCVKNVGGRRCEKCLAGFYGYPHCYECACDLTGSNAEICDQNSATCLCKENVIGSTCATCAPGTFNLARDNEKGCTECFCFGVTDNCRSSTFKKTSVVDMYGWKVPTWVGKYRQTEIDGKVEVVFDENDVISKRGKLVYLSSPISYLGNRLLSYGGRIEYMIMAMPVEEEENAVTVSPDLIMRVRMFMFA